MKRIKKISYFGFLICNTFFVYRLIWTNKKSCCRYFQDVQFVFGIFFAVCLTFSVISYFPYLLKTCSTQNLLRHEMRRHLYYYLLPISVIRSRAVFQFSFNISFLGVTIKYEIHHMKLSKLIKDLRISDFFKI